VTPERERDLRALAERLGHPFGDIGLLDRALTHTSCANEDLSGETHHNEPFEFLGDAILGFVVADRLHRRDPEGDEGHKTRARAAVVSAASLAQHAAALGLPELLVLGRGEEKTGGRRKKALWSDAFEAVVAALYLDGGLEAVDRFVGAQLGTEIESGAAYSPRDYKSALQEVLQGRSEPVPQYEILEEIGPAHRRRFRVACRIQGRTVSEGEGHSKKEGQQEAARRALEALEGEGR
jgi:ribonuclease III